MRLGVDRDLPFLHGLEKRCLCLRAGAVDLVAEDHVGEHGARPEVEGRPLPIPDRHARDVRREQVRGELDPLEGAIDRTSERLGEKGLADARYVLDQDVPLGHQARYDEVDRRRLALDDLADIRRDSFELVAEPREFILRQGHGASLDVRLKQPEPYREQGYVRTGSVGFLRVRRAATKVRSRRVHTTRPDRRAEEARPLGNRGRRLLRLHAARMVENPTIPADSRFRCDQVEGDYCLWTSRYDPCCG